MGLTKPRALPPYLNGKVSNAEEELEKGREGERMHERAFITAVRTPRRRGARLHGSYKRVC